MLGRGHRRFAGTHGNDRGPGALDIGRCPGEQCRGYGDVLQAGNGPQPVRKIIFKYDFIQCICLWCLLKLGRCYAMEEEGVIE